MYVWLTNHPRSEDQYVSVHYTIGSEGWFTNYETRYDGEGCYNVTHFVVESMGSIGNHQWLEITFGLYNKLSSGSEHWPTCIPNMYRYRVIYTMSKYPDENVEEMIEKYVEDNNIKALHRQDTFECDV